VAGGAVQSQSQVGLVAIGNRLLLRRRLRLLLLLLLAVRSGGQQQESSDSEDSLQLGITLV